jgi:hypothetical protein
MVSNPTTLSRQDEIDILIKIGENHLLKDINAHEKLQVESCLKSLRTLKIALQEQEKIGA